MDKTSRSLVDIGYAAPEKRVAAFDLDREPNRGTRTGRYVEVRAVDGPAYLATRGEHIRISLATTGEGIDLVRSVSPDLFGRVKRFSFMNGSPRRRSVERLYEYLLGLDDARQDLGAPRFTRVIVDRNGMAYKVFAGTGGGVIDEIMTRLGIDGEAMGSLPVPA